jgi:predicted nucleic acid-binding protein
MNREYSTSREYLDAVCGQVGRMVLHHQHVARSTSDDAALRTSAELGLEIDRNDDIIRARCEASAAVGIELPLEQLRRAFSLSITETRVIEVLVALELDAQVRQLASAFLDRSGMATIELVESLVYRSSRTRGASGVELVADAALFRYQIADIGSSELPWLARPLKIASRVIELALGRMRLAPDVARVADLLLVPRAGDAMLVDPATRSLVDAAVRAQLDRDGGAPIPVIVGPEGSGRASLVHAAAHLHRIPVMDVRASQLPRDEAKLVTLLYAIVREAKLFGAMLLVRQLDDLVGNEERHVPDRVGLVTAILTRSGMAVAITATTNVWPSTERRPIVLVELGIPGELERRTLWQRVLGEPTSDVAQRAAERYRVTAGVIERAAAFAEVQATARSGPIELADVRVGIRLLLDKDLSTLGRRVEWKQTWDDVVLPPDVRGELDELVGRIRHRRRVLEDWGFARKLAKGVGVSALFSGPPGTGKTMVAGLLAKELELDLYMIDASRMVSKWIGETEKNLARLFDAASAGHAALLFDEADSLFAKRTEVKSSTDRYANLEVNYLLQRMEAFEGITILTTNLESSIDDAFKRRLAFRIAFPMPEAEERAQLWRAMLPAEALVARDIDFDLLASKFEMSGGYIRNAVVRAAYLAAAEDGTISMRHLQRGGTLEYTAMGKVIHHDSSL